MSQTLMDYKQHLDILFDNLSCSRKIVYSKTCQYDYWDIIVYKTDGFETETECTLPSLHCVLSQSHSHDCVRRNFYTTCKCACKSQRKIQTAKSNRAMTPQF